MGKAKSYAERLFEFPEIGPLPPDAARLAIANPALAEGVVVTDNALRRIIERTQGHPYFLQERGKHAWDAADASPIDVDDVERANSTAIAALDASFFRLVRYVRARAKDEAAAWELFRASAYKEYSFTDCVSFVMMRRLGIGTAVAVDEHFRQEGFDVLP